MLDRPKHSPLVNKARQNAEETRRQIARRVMEEQRRPALPSTIVLGRGDAAAVAQHIARFGHDEGPPTLVAVDVRRGERRRRTRNRLLTASAILMVIAVMVVLLLVFTPLF